MEKIDELKIISMLQEGGSSPRNEEHPIQGGDTITLIAAVGEETAIANPDDSMMFNSIDVAIEEFNTRDICDEDLMDNFVKDFSVVDRSVSLPNNMIVYMEEELVNNNQLVDNEEPVNNNQLLNNEEMLVNDVDELPVQKRTRKKIPNPENWKRNVRRKKYQAGEQYKNAKGKTVEKKKLVSKKDCLNNCKLKCGTNITDDERESLFSGFYKLQTQNEKSLFILNHSERYFTTRKTKQDEEAPSRRKYSFKYFFKVKSLRVQVCKSFFLSTLQISQKPIYNAHEKKDPTTGYPKPDSRGSAKGIGLPEYAKNDVRNHIKSFPTIESHYCRADSKKQYLESSLNLAKMYSLFKEKHPNHIIKDSMYRHIFYTEYNLDFHVPKKDRCDLCEEHKVALQENVPYEEVKYLNHISAKTAMRKERKKDMDRTQNEVPVLSFDLQNVITCPRAEISSLFYYSKLNVYNLTAHLQTKTSKSVYCAVWPETMAGRSGNDLASAVHKVMTKVLQQNPLFEEIITWSDSCVPQNKNQMMSGAMMLILKEHPNLKTITMKYSTAGHGAVQVVDNIHSHIEKAMTISEFFSPLGLIRLLKKVSPKCPYNILQMSRNDFLNFADSSKELNFATVPFTKVCMIKFTQTFGEIQYKEIHCGEDYIVNVKPGMTTAPTDRNTRKKSTCKRVNEQLVGYKNPKVQVNVNKLRNGKIRDLKLMQRFMALVDRQYYDCLLRNQ